MPADPAYYFSPSRGAYITFVTYMPTSRIILSKISQWPIRKLIRIMMDIPGGWKRGFSSKTSRARRGPICRPNTATITKRSDVWAHVQLQPPLLSLPPLPQRQPGAGGGCRLQQPPPPPLGRAGGRAGHHMIMMTVLIHR